RIKVITVRTTGFDPAATGGSASVEAVAAVADSGMSSFVGREVTKSDRPELTAAKIIVSGGRAMGSSDKFNEVLTPLADKLGAARKRDHDGAAFNALCRRSGSTAIRTPARSSCSLRYARES